MEAQASNKRLGMVDMPEPDLEVASLYGSSYGRYKPVSPKHQARRNRPAKIVDKPDPDSELESLADFKSRTTM